MACNLEKVASETAQDKPARVAKTACKKEACAIQACLQGETLAFRPVLQIALCDCSK